MAQVVAPTKSLLPSELRVSPTNAAVYRILSRLSRSSLLSLALDWVEEGTAPVTRPYLLSTADGRSGDIYLNDFYPPAHSLEELQQVYHDLQNSKGSKREVLDRILQGDWRNGLTLYQLAMADFQYLSDHPLSQKWMAHQIIPLKRLDSPSLDQELFHADAESLFIPRVHPSTFLESLRKQVLPDAKAHFQFDQRRKGSFVLLRVFVVDSPYNAELALSNKHDGHISDFSSSRTLYVAFPDGSPFLYVSKAQTAGPSVATDSRAVRHLVLTGMRRALSRSRESYSIVSTNLFSRSLPTLLRLRGHSRSNAAGGGWSIYADGQPADTPLDTCLGRSTTFISCKDGAKYAGKRNRSYLHTDGGRSKRSRLAAAARFGSSRMICAGTGVERVDVKVTDRYPTPGSIRRQSEATNPNPMFQDGIDRNDMDIPPVPSRDDTWTPKVRLTFQGVHVFGGMRQLAGRGILDGKRMPGWLTGEDNVSIGVVQEGKLRNLGEDQF